MGHGGAQHRCGRPGWRALRGNTRGVAALEFAMLFPVIFILLLGTVEVGYVMMIDASLEMSVREASRYGLASAGNTGETRDERIEQIVHDWLDRWISNPNDIDIDIRTWPAFDNIGEPEPLDDENGNGTWDEGEEFDDLNDNGKWDADLSTAGAGGREEIVVYTVDFTRPTITGIPTMAGIGSYHFNRRIVLQNE